MRRYFIASVKGELVCYKHRSTPIELVPRIAHRLPLLGCHRWPHVLRVERRYVVVVQCGEKCIRNVELFRLPNNTFALCRFRTLYLGFIHAIVIAEDQVGHFTVALCACVVVAARSEGRRGGVLDKKRDL